MESVKEEEDRDTVAGVYCRVCYTMLDGGRPNDAEPPSATQTGPEVEEDDRQHAEVDANLLHELDVSSAFDGRGGDDSAATSPIQSLPHGNATLCLLRLQSGMSSGFGVVSSVLESVWPILPVLDRNPVLPPRSQLHTLPDVPRGRPYCFMQEDGFRNRSRC